MPTLAIVVGATLVTIVVVVLAAKFLGRGILSLKISTAPPYRPRPKWEDPDGGRPLQPAGVPAPRKPPTLSGAAEQKFPEEGAA